MKRESKKHREQRLRLKPDRDALKKEFPFCMVCGKRRRLTVHEIAKGHQHRWKAIELRSCQLVACWECNAGPLNDYEEYPPARQLALQFKYMPKYANLAEFNRVRARRGVGVTMEDVAKWLRFV